MITSSTDAAMKAKLIRIGNSRGIRIPKPLIEAAGLGDEVDLEARDGELVIRRIKRVREGWAEDAKKAAASGDDKLIWPSFPNKFDHEEWEW